MYENIRKPGLLKNIPILFIRALPSLYYYSKFGIKFKHDGCRQLFMQNLEYLMCAMELINKQINNEQLDQTINILDQLRTIRHQDIIPTVERFTINLSDYCNKNIQECRNFYKENKQKLIDLYRNKVIPLHILITDIQTDQKLPHLLSDFCYYDIQHAFMDKEDYTDKLSTLMLFTNRQ